MMGAWICIALVVGAAVVVWFMRRGEPDPAWPKWKRECPECEDTEPSAGNPAGQCFSCWSKEPAIFTSNDD